MELIYLLWGYVHDEPIIKAFRQAGIIVKTIDIRKNKNADQKPVLLEEQELRDRICSAGGDVVFSVNFFCMISDLCMKEVIPYCCWVLELPNLELYQPQVNHTCNYIGICDSYLVEKLWKIGMKRAFFLPDAVGITGEYKENTEVEREACFIGKYPDVQWNEEGMSLYAKGYLEAFLHAQRVVKGAFILEEGLHSRVRKEFVEKNPVPEHILPEFAHMYIADRYFAPRCTAMQQDIVIQNYESILTVYSDRSLENCKAIRKPYVESAEKREEIYASKEFTFVLVPHTQHYGIPRQLLEVIAAGGFPLAEYRKDYTYFFKNNENLAWFENTEAIQNQILRYGNDPSERERVRKNAWEYVRKEHTYQKRILFMMEMWEKLS